MEKAIALVGMMLVCWLMNRGGPKPPYSAQPEVEVMERIAWWLRWAMLRVHALHWWWPAPELELYYCLQPRCPARVTRVQVLCWQPIAGDSKLWDVDRAWLREKWSQRCKYTPPLRFFHAIPKRG
jgi:hypothetical protein